MTKYTEETVKSICKFLREGETVVDACALAGISKKTHYEWIEKHSDYGDAILVAEAEASRERTQRVRAAGVRAVKRQIKGPDGKMMEVIDIDGDWKADAWWLERRRREEYATKSIHDVTSSDQGIQNALQLVGALLEGAKTGRRKAKRDA